MDDIELFIALVLCRRHNEEFPRWDCAESSFTLNEFVCSFNSYVDHVIDIHHT